MNGSLIQELGCRECLESFETDGEHLSTGRHWDWEKKNGLAALWGQDISLKGEVGPFFLSHNPGMVLPQQYETMSRVIRTWSTVVLTADRHGVINERERIHKFFQDPLFVLLWRTNPTRPDTKKLGFGRSSIIWQLSDRRLILRFLSPCALIKRAFFPIQVKFNESRIKIFDEGKK